jgi:hypothetical protein
LKLNIALLALAADLSGMITVPDVPLTTYVIVGEGKLDNEKYTTRAKSRL